MPGSLPIDDETAALLYRTLRLDGFFPELTKEQAAKLFPRSGLEFYPADIPVIQQGDSGRDLYIIQAGGVSVSQTFGSAGAQLSTLGPGDIFGEMGLISDGVRRATITTTLESKIYRLAFQDVQYLLQNNPALGKHLQSLAAARS